MGRGALQTRELPAVPGKRPSPPLAVVSHNLNGQKLGRKGRLTRERILSVTAEILIENDEPLSLSAVARRASLGMTSLYNYFTDLTELLVAVLEPVMATAEEGYVAMLRDRWSDEDLGDRCAAFARAYYAFWSRHARLLHLRNTMADGGDRRMLLHRIMSTQPLIGLIAAQMEADPSSTEGEPYAMATVLMTGLERMVTVVTDNQFAGILGDDRGPSSRDELHYLKPGARLMEMAIRDFRQRARAQG